MLRLSPAAAIATCLLAIIVLGSFATSAGAAPITTTLAQRAAAATAATKKVGAPYRLGAAGPRAFDCSGLVDFAYRVAGIQLGARTSQEQSKLGAKIRRSAIRRGDLVFTWSRSYGHVGIAIGMGRYVHAPAPGRKVTIAPIPAGAGLIAVRRP